MSNVTPDLDLSFLEEIADGSDDFIIESIDMFMQQTPQLMGDIDNGIAGQNWPVAAAAAHKLKPNLGFFGMLTCQGLMQDIEHMAKTGAPDVQAITGKFNSVREIIDANLNRLVEIKAEKGA
ncbi:Hpt domain-containing protein [Mucilaginibacter sp. Bleaf8]|uniref:Hpt domain-containing protein n=1 Tax=Mucilaginibacter sp. Bleaf8 TaxID=2834430 RepID=UPI001BCE6EA3|nr:Hpt domain-containing protein [Mucilaginibacter sp. Bleaf8]MBS7563537.1 Hpt domain-containing protein [Mucilaginibacter sp. Bleaf8]